MNLHHHSSSSIRLFSSEGEATLTNLLNNFLERIRREMAKCFGGPVLPSVGCASNDNDVARFRTKKIETKFKRKQADW
jgi:hypothetical protein